MTRPLRIQYEEALYHITSRGNEQADIFLDDQDREYFLLLLAQVVERYDWLVYAFCLMANHYHLLVKTINANLSDGMRQLNGVYAQRFNRLNERVGHLFQGRFNSVIIEEESHLLTTARYIVLNPLRAGIVTHPEDWPWSSYRAMIGISQPPPFLHVDLVLGFFSGEKREAVRQFIVFVFEGMGKEPPFSEARGGLILGKEQFAIEVMKRIEEEISDEITRREKFAARPTLESIFSSNTRDKGIYNAIYQYGYRLKEVGTYLGIHYSIVSRAGKREAERKINSHHWLNNIPGGVAKNKT